MGINSERNRVLPWGEREDWLLREIYEERFVDVLNKDFSDHYAQATGASVTPMTWGANKCALLTKDLARLAKLGFLKRTTCGLSSGAWQPGFPKWVYSYEISSSGRARIGLPALSACAGSI